VVGAVLTAASERLAAAARSGDEDQVTIQDVADRAGVGLGSIYDYFRDRRSVLGAVVAKMTEDNLRAFEAMLASTEELSLEEGIGRMVDFLFSTYLAHVRTSRALLKIAHSTGLMAALAESQTLFAESLCAALRKRGDVRKDDIDLAAWTGTQAVMGVVNTLIWQETPVYAEERVRAEVVRLFADYFRG
jgi:AcrR family transcriptional regulator